MNLEILEIGPQTAAELLAKNTNNRRVRPNKVNMYAGAIDRNEWHTNGDSIRIAEDGTLLDGQHRLMAVVKANKPIRTVVITGLPKDTQETMDRGDARTIGDMLKIRGEKNAALLGSTLNLLYAYSKVGNLSPNATKTPPTAQQIFEFLQNHPEIRNYFSPPGASMCYKLLTPSVVSGLYYLFSLVDERDADEFFRLLATGDGLSQGHPIFALRERLIREMQKAQGRISPTVRAALTVKAFNFYREGRQVFTLKWVGGGGRAETFPRVQECPLVPEIDLKR